MKKTLFLFSLIIIIFEASVAHAAGFVPLTDIPGLTSNLTADQKGLADFLNNLYKYLIGLASAIAVVMIIWGGIEYSTQDVPGSKQNGKDRIQGALMGLVLILSPVLVFSIINPSILNLSIGLPELRTTPVATGSSQNSGGIPVVDSSTGCTVTGSLLKKASCPTQNAANEFVAKCEGSGKSLSCQVENSSGCADKSFQATCSNAPTGPYVFLDVSNAYIPLSLFSDYQPLVSSNADANNGANALRFAATCSQDGGMTCLSGSTLSIQCTYATAQATSQSNKCYSATITCEPSSLVNRLSLCSSSPSWNPIK